MLPALLLQLSLAALDVSGTSTCPSPEAVAKRVDDLAPRLSSSPGLLRATVSTAKDGVHVELRDAEDRTLAQKVISGSKDCDALAAATSVVLVAWAREFEAAGRAAPAPGPQMPAQDLSASPEQLREERKEREYWTVEVDAAAGLSASISRSVAIGGLLTGGMTSRQGHFGGQLSLAALGARSEAGETTWERFAILGTPHYRFRFSTLHLDVNAGAVAALLSIIPQGEGGARTAFDPGATAGVRVLSTGGLWAGTQAIGWFRERSLPSGTPLPRFEVLVTGGLAWSYP